MGRALGSTVLVTNRLAVAVVALALVGATTGCSDAPGSADTGPVPFTFEDGVGATMEDDLVGTIGLSAIARINVTAPVTILGVRPLHADPAMKVLAVRAWFHGFGISASGYRQYSGLPLGTCVHAPITGHGPSYPVEGLTLKPGDQPHFVAYVQVQAVGEHRVSGVHIDYQMPGRRPASTEGGNGWFAIPAVASFDPGDSRHVRCRPNDWWARPEPGYPR